MVIKRRKAGRAHRFAPICLAVALALSAGPTFADDPTFEDGVRAYLAEDYENALAVWRPLGEEGHAAAQFGLGLAYENGRGVNQDFVQAAVWYRRAADQNLVDAQFNLGNLYLNGQGVKRDPEEAVRWFRRAAEQNMPHAQVNLGYSYEMGSGVPLDPVQAVSWYRKAAEADFAQAQYYLGAAYEGGVGVEQDLALAAAWYERASNRGVTLAQSRLATLMDKGIEPATIDDTAPETAIAQTAEELAEIDTAAGNPTEPVETPDEGVTAGGDSQAAAETGGSTAATSDAGADATAAPEPVAKPEGSDAEIQTARAEPSATAEPGGRIASLQESHRVRLAAYREPGNAERGWAKLSEKHGDLLADLNYAFSRVDLGPEKGVFIRLEAGPLGSGEEAQAICDEIKKRGDSCLTVRP